MYILFIVDCKFVITYFIHNYSPKYDLQFKKNIYFNFDFSL